MKTRLYIVEGLPCSGKSTTSKYIAELLEKRSEKVFYADEAGGNHPADYEFHSYLTEDDLMLLSKTEQEQIIGIAERVEVVSSDIETGNAIGESRRSGFIVPLGKFEGELFEKLLQYKIYDFLDWEKEMPIMLEKWKSFYNSADEEIIYVFNCCLLQNPMCETMMRFGFSMEQSMRFINRICEIIRPLQPVVVYLKNDDIAERIAKTAEEREGWLDAVIDYHVNGAYGKSIDAKGFKGYISCLEERQKRELAILSQIPVESIVVENPHRDWEDAYEKIKELIVKGNNK